MLPPVCAREPSASTAPPAVCTVTTAQGAKRVEISLKAVTQQITVGGYAVVTDNYNASYLSPVVEADAGDTVAARVENLLGQPQPSAGHVHNATGKPTNLHFFHGGVVTPRNARRANDPDDMAATRGNGDNVYSYLKTSDVLTYEVPIPSSLDARVIDGEGVIPHPSGLNWYHSHLHGISSDQVMGGLSGLLSVGNAKANVVGCKPDPADQNKCNDDPNATAQLKARTDVRYALLRDISLKDISALPEAGTGAPKTATWAPDLKDFLEEQCGVWRTAGGQVENDPKLRKGYCQRDQTSAWLFTVNGQRFPTITVEGGRNLLLRLGNLSSNVVYWLELANEQDDSDKQKLLLLGIDGVVPAKPVPADPNRQPVRATAVDDLVFMPASRAEILIRNDCLRPQAKTYILRTRGLIAGNDNPINDRWPEIQLMRIVLEPSTVSCTENIALNVGASEPAAFPLTGAVQAVVKPAGCVNDIELDKIEHRKVTFVDSGTTTGGLDTRWSVLTEIMHPKDGASSAAVPYSDFVADPNKTVGIEESPGKFRPIPFEEYHLADGKIDWNKRHTCVFVNPGDPSHKSSQQQLWVLHNTTGDLHNFHIHQMKFRLATGDELGTRFKIKLDGVPSEVCGDGSPPPCAKGPVYRLYDARPENENTRWHDTIPVPPDPETGVKVYVIMSFVAEEQIGRYVYHCHILKHEDSGLMAPIEVWKPGIISQ